MAEADVVEVEGAEAAAAEIAEQCFAGVDDDDEEEEEVEDEPEYLSESEQQQQQEEEEEEEGEEEELLTAEEELERYKEAMTKLIATTQQYQRDVEDEKRRAEDEHGAEVAGLLEELEAERALNSRLREENLANIRSVYAQIQEYERVNEERLRAALESGNEIVESVVKLKVSTRRGKPTEVVLLAPRPAADGGDGGDGGDSDGEDGDKTRSAKELELAMQLRCLQKENQFLINKLSEQKQQHFEDIETERRVSEEAIGKVKELVASHMATLQRLDDARKEADDAKRALQDARAEAEALRAQVRAAEMAQAMSTATAASSLSSSKSKKPTWGQLARGKKQQQQQQQQQPQPSAAHVAAEDTSAPSPQQQQH